MAENNNNNIKNKKKLVEIFSETEKGKVLWSLTCCFVVADKVRGKSEYPTKEIVFSE